MTGTELTVYCNEKFWRERIGVQRYTRDAVDAIVVNSWVCKGTHCNSELDSIDY